MKEKHRKNVEILTGDPKKAIIKISVPIMIGGLFQTLYSFVDGIWVSGIGPDSLAAVGLFMPFMLILTSIAMGLGVGGSSAISRAIGANDRARASNAAEHTLIAGTVIGSVISFSILPFLHTIFKIMGAGSNVTALATAYGTVIIAGSPMIFISNLGSAILRGEGDTKRAMYLMLISSVLNMILDPFFIFTLNMGVVGAAIATMISISVNSIIILHWLIHKRDTYVQMNLRYFHRNFAVLKEIFSVGLPSSLSQISISLTMIVLNTIVIMAGGDYGMAVFSSGWRVIMLAAVPMMGLAAAVTSVTGAAFGARDAAKLKTAYYYSVKIGVIIGIVIGTLIWIFAPQLTYLFTYSESSSSLAPGIIEFLRYIVLFFPGMAGGMLTSSMFRGIGKGMYSLAQNIMRTVVLQILFTYTLGILLGYGLVGIWIGIVTANLTSAVIGLTWGSIVVRRYEKTWCGKN